MKPNTHSKKISITILVVLLLVAFQNCGKSTRGPADSHVLLTGDPQPNQAKDFSDLKQSAKLCHDFSRGDTNLNAPVSNEPRQFDTKNQKMDEREISKKMCVEVCIVRKNQVYRQIVPLDDLIGGIIQDPSDGIITLCDDLELENTSSLDP